MNSEEKITMENNRYNNSKIYKLVDQVNGYFYIGSTCNQLSKRLSWHKITAKIKPEQKVYKYFNSIGWENVKIVLIQENYLDNKEQLLREEDNVIQMCIHDEKCLNINRAFVSHEEALENCKKYYQCHKEDQLYKAQKYRNDHREERNEQAKEYYKNNKQARLKYRKEYVEEHKEEIQQKMKVYRETINIEYLERRKTEKIVCGCGVEIRKADIRKHERTKRHQAWLHEHQQTAETI